MPNLRRMVPHVEAGDDSEGSLPHARSAPHFPSRLFGKSGHHNLIFAALDFDAAFSL
jgi:hypothetical protein